MYDFIPSIMRKGAEIMLSATAIDASVTSKEGEANFVTAYDVAVQDYLLREIGQHLPQALLIGEESEEDTGKLLSAPLSLIVDPIDGTTNFIHDYRCSSISVALLQYGEPVFGAVYDPYMDRMFSAERGHGAFIEEKGQKRPISVSSRSLSSALTCFGTSPYYREELGEATFTTAHRFFRATRDVRRSGSAALDLCSIAYGSTDVFFEYRLAPWDFAAGALIITEAGGKITKMDGSPLSYSVPCAVVAGNPLTHAAVLKGNFFI